MKGTVLLIIGLIIIIAIAAVVILGGFIPGLQGMIPGLSSAEKSYPSAENCDYTEMEILSMLEVGANKDLNNQIGCSYVRALNMQACGVDDETVSQILSYFDDEYSDWYEYYRDTASGAGYTTTLVIWTNSPAATNSTLARSVAVVDGVTVESAYGYDTMVISSDGSVLAYATFLAWVNAS